MIIQSGPEAQRSKNNKHFFSNTRVEDTNKQSDPSIHNSAFYSFRKSCLNFSVFYIWNQQLNNAEKLKTMDDFHVI